MTCFDGCWEIRATDLFHAGGVFEKHEAKASGSASVRINLDGAVRHLAKLTEVILEVFFTRLPAETAHEHFSANTVGHLAVSLLLFQKHCTGSLSKYRI